jgi:MFS family permease
MMVISTELGPLIGATIIQGQDWRWTFWIASIFIGLSIAVVLPNPETYKPEILRRRAKKMKIEVSRRELKSVVLVAVGRPLHMLVTEPIMWPTALVVAVYQAILFCFYVAYPLMFERVYLFTTFKVGLAFIPLLVGSLLAIPIVAYLDKAKYQKEKADAEREGRPIRPESRLYAAMVGSILMPISLFW